MLEPGAEKCIWERSFSKTSQRKGIPSGGGIVSTKPQVRNNAHVSGAVSVQALVEEGAALQVRGKGWGWG